MSDFLLLTDLLYVLVLALVFGFLAKKAKQPVIIGYLVGGGLGKIFLGSFLGSQIQVLADIGVALLMFTLGLEFSLRRLTRVKEIAVLGGVLQLILSAIIFTVIFSFLGFSFYVAFFLSLAFSLSSTAIVVKVLSDKGELDTVHAEVLIGWLLIQDLAVVPMMVILPSVHQALLTPQILPGLWVLFLSIIKSGFFLYLVFLLGKRLVPKTLLYVAKIGIRELFLTSVILWVFILAGLSSWVGLSPAIGAFLAGLLISETSQNHAVFAEIRPLRDLLSIVFFVTLGLLWQPEFFFFHLSFILTISTLVLLLKFILVVLLVFYFGYHGKTALEVGAGLAGVGEFAFVLGRFGLSLNLIDNNANNFLLSVTFITMLFTPLLLALARPGYHFLKEKTKIVSPFLYERLFLHLDKRTGEHKQLELKEHVVICGHGRVGKHIGRLLDISKIPFIVVDFNQKVVSELLQSGIAVLYGDPTDYEVLDSARVEKARALVIAVPDRSSQEMIIQNALRLNKNIVIICRCHFEEDKKRLYALGCHFVVQPEFEAGIYMGGQLLRLFGFAKEEIGEYLRRVRKEG